MSDFVVAVADLAPVLVVGVLIGLGGYVATYLWEERDYKRRAREHAAAQERAERQERVNRFAADTRAAFEAQMANRPHIAAMRARQEAEAFDPDAVDWTQRSGR